jgi:prolyl-tRNA synthetase
MRMSQLVGRTLREAPRDAELPSHKYLVRAGYVKQYSSGIYGLLPLAWRSLQKIEAICRNEMNALGGQELRMPTMTTRELWQETGRYGAIGKEMFRFKDRHDKDHVLCMTHEEPVVAIARTELTSYKQLPAMLYQFQTKFRDEPRPRGGLVRTREFIMKDGYSFHPDEESLLEYYQRAHKAYERFYHRIGLTKVASVRSDNGMFGGKFSHEFMLLAPTGEDTLIVCSSCDYKANVEAATLQRPKPKTDDHSASSPLRVVATPGIKTIADLVAYLKTDATTGLPLNASGTCKAVLFETVPNPQNKNEKSTLVCAFVRGDRDVTEQKLVSLLGKNLMAARPDTIAAAGAVAGSTGPLVMTTPEASRAQLLDLERVIMVFDLSLDNGHAFVVGANRDGEHLTGFQLRRDVLDRLPSLPEPQRAHVLCADIMQVVDGDPCPHCGAPLTEARGIEIGNIFHLGTKYSSAMGATFLDHDGKKHDLVMGCYGIGITRALAALAEEHHDEHGMVLPIPSAPFDLQLNALNLGDPSVRSLAEDLYLRLKAQGVDVLFDDRDEKAGSQFADADLIGIPLRLVVAPRGVQAGQLEFKYRDRSRAGTTIPLSSGLDGVAATLKGLVDDEHKRYTL